VVLGGSTAAYALTGASLPEPVRAAAHAVGLPVDSVALADARAASAKLKEGLRAHDRAVVDDAARRLRERVSRLDADDRHSIAPEANALLGEANQFDAEPDPTGQADRGDQGSPLTPGTGGHDNRGGRGSPPLTGAGGQDGSGSQGSPPLTGTGTHDGNIQERASASDEGVAGVAGGQNTLPPAAARE
ncbi:MAG: hypothetical protein M3Z84_03335, partial [Actinomycetota bacterium]|nr:hypothetical protein [Actinomycetota bacterium]